ncbi:sensor histidine kinase [Sphingomonas abietis]|uniref:histidine kinase n=1 Tax=Sphingomonas abietis TaxID=3012344 RepID=A0ABY7NIK0_9SPHN|nr:ATP-binding protein [Sphingomonas abietis]WBO21304.1 ATP-binding protein [Sphingomonas abietis]
MMRSAAYRISIIYSLAFSLAMVALGGAVYLSAHVALRGQLDDRISAETSSLLSEYHREGEGSLRGLILLRGTAQATRSLGYALYAPDGRRIVGTLNAGMPQPGWQTILFQDGDDRADKARALTIVLANRERLVVAADRDAIDGIDHAIVGSLLIALLVVIGIGAAGALLLGAYLRRRLSTISVAAEGIIAGDLHTRIPIGPRDDEFDRMSRALNAMLDRIGALIETLRQVSSDIAHDLRTPLTRLRNHLEDGLAEAPGNATIARAIEQSDDVLALFGAILRLSEIEAGRLRETFRPVDLSGLAAEICDSYAPAIEDRGRTLDCAITAVAPIRGDRELIAQALINLLDNAQAHTPPGTRIRLVLEPIAGGCRLGVIDDGPGIAAADRGRVTRRFARLEASRNTPGHGLGLSLVAAVAHIHGAALVLTDAGPGLSISLEFTA